MTMTIAVAGDTHVQASLRMYEVLLARGNGERVVTVHRGRITKVTPIKRDEDVCVNAARPLSGFVDNGEMLKRLFAEPFGEYVVTVCYGRITDVAPVAKEEAVKVQDMDIAGAAETVSTGKARTKKTANT